MLDKDPLSFFVPVIVFAVVVVGVLLLLALGLVKVF